MVIYEKKIPTFSLLAILNVTGSLHSLSSFVICWNLLFSDSEAFFITFFLSMNLLRAFLKAQAHKDSCSSWAGQQEVPVGPDNSPAQLSSVTPEVSGAPYSPPITSHPCSPLCHSCPGCAHNRDPQVMQTWSHTHLLFLPSFDEKRAVQQLRACGVLETIRISAAGFPSRCVCSLWIAFSCSSF